MKSSILLGIAALWTAVATSGCSAGAASRPEIGRSVHDGAIWVRPGDVDRYFCTDGLFVCASPVGRTSDRLCRCEPR